ncbi:MULTISPECIES: hypothetical protein [Enterococcus]|uniref:Uncharacterized protein n=1 Tax=Enterococcus malodoratus ATCC 43197 TaxID=1158601 RepID=R2NXQ5_9ENTE|nr:MULTISPECIES: hypothetical protein [Enterococcus]EOH75823.1 hypothetical protein UAI_02833 [Enterococcus malodoratus ATCC 43197]EOT66492.1 hypothetical protein I585_02013 [Enterococcus malodoratus ATCC 43197]OJG64682.1 hypothetical protein RV07_GL004058 [Enterococcus malodoratus]SPW90501.1 Uncharacterised protein [Enterococcus malodoratus]STD69098.1 Uncharacterised protein [Enterococcus malodoratus]
MDKYQQRKQRGWVETSDLLAYKDKFLSELNFMLTAEDARERTIAVQLLPLDCELTNILLNSLANESALYTRLAIMEKLEHGDQATAQKMIPFLASIGNNQHHSPTSPSKKKSFPLPRDLIARSLGRMNPKIFSILLESAQRLPLSQLSELIDAIGYMAFYHPEVSTTENFHQLLEIQKLYRDKPLIQWKLLICFSAFPQSVDFLLQEKQFVSEAQRSLKLLAAKED